MKKMLTNNLGLKFLSVIAAVMLWLIVVNVDDPVTYQDFSSIRVTMLNEEAVTGKDKVYKIEDNSDVISLRVWAKRSVLEQLSAEDFTATADMQKNIKFDNLVGIEVACSNRNVRTADISKSRENVVISIEDASSEQFNVVVRQDGQPDDNYVVGSALPEQSLIEISGPASVIARIKRVEATLNITGFNSDRTENCELRLYDGEGVQVDNTYLDYVGKTEGMNVTVTMLRKKEVRLRMGYTGTPAEDYSFAGFSYRPETVTIAGTQESIARVSEITVPDEEVNIDGISEDLETVLDITKYLPENIRLANESQDALVSVSVKLEKKQGKTLRIPVDEIELVNVPRGMEVDFEDQKEIEVIIRGTRAELAELNEEEVRIRLDLDEYSRAGTYTQKIEAEMPEQYSLMEDVEVEFSLVRIVTATGGAGGN